MDSALRSIPIAPRIGHGLTGILLVLTVLAGIARLQEPDALRHFGVRSYWDSVQTYYWSLLLLVPWFAQPWGTESAQTSLARVARQLPMRSILLSCIGSLMVSVIYGAAFLGICITLDFLCGGTDSLQHASRIGVLFALVPLPLAALLPALASRALPSSRAVVGVLLAVTLVTLLGGGANARLATLPPQSFMDSTVFRTAGTLALLTLATATLAYGLLTKRRA